MVRQSWFDTLNESLMSESLLAAWDIHAAPIQYGETRRWIVDDRLISVSRNEEGRYERPVHYAVN